MSSKIEKCLATIKEGITSLKNIKKDKREYKAYLKRIQMLPGDYRFVFKKMTAYMWNFAGGGSGYDMMALQADLLELFEVSAAEGKPVVKVTGLDVAAFCDELLRNAKTYTGNWRDRLNHDVMERLEQEPE